MFPVPSSHVLIAIWKWAVYPFRQITQLPPRICKFSDISFPSLHYSFLSRRRRNRKTVITCWYIWITEIEVKRITLAYPWPAMVINCCVKLKFKATPRIKKWPLVLDQILYHIYLCTISYFLDLRRVNFLGIQWSRSSANCQRMSETVSGERWG